MFERIAPEQHDTLADIPEPAENPLLAGHQEAASRLAAAHRAGKLHHALIFAGPQGIGKATLAFHLAHHLLKHRDGTEARDHLAVPDPSSPLFRLIAGGAHPSILHLTRPLNDRTKAFRTAVTVEEVRKVQRFLSMTSHDGGYRVVIIDPADDMNQNAANALLKSLEEPPARTQFVLISHAAGGLLPTIRSRCQMIRLQPLPEAEFRIAVDGIGLSLPEGEAGVALARRAAGSVRDAVLLTQYGGLEIADAVEGASASGQFAVGAAHRIADAVAGRDKAIAFALFNRHVLDRAASLARHAAEQGDFGRAERLSAFWSQASETVMETETYNLDKRQHVAGLMRALHEARNG